MTLFIDDIFDTGNGFANIISKVDCPSKLIFVTLLARRGKKLLPKLFTQKNKTNNYVVFPWDALEFKKHSKQSSCYSV